MQSWFVLSQVPPSTSTAGTGSEPTPGGASSGTIVASTQNSKDAGTKDAPNPLTSFLPIILVLVVMYLFLFRPKGKEAKKQKAMLESLKRGDRVMTIGGLIGSVVEVKGDEVVLKVDESNNVKERYIKSAIQKVLVDGDKAEEPKK